MHDEDLALRLRMLTAFASPFDVPELFPLVLEQLDIPEALHLSLYFKRTYIGRTLPGGGQINPVLPITMWNHHHEVTIGISRLQM